jgi:hypothetical protein
MKCMIALMAVLTVQTAVAASFPITAKCKHRGDGNRDITVVLTEKTATLVGFWNAGEKDEGVRTGDTPYGQLAYVGFPIFTDDGQSGQMYVDRALVNSGRGKLFLQNYYCEDHCSLRRFAYSCTAKGAQ